MEWEGHSFSPRRNDEETWLGVLKHGQVDYPRLLWDNETPQEGLEVRL